MAINKNVGNDVFCFLINVKSLLVDTLKCRGRKKYPTLHQSHFDSTILIDFLFFGPVAYDARLHSRRTNDKFVTTRYFLEPKKN